MRRRDGEEQTDHSHPLFVGSRASSLNASAGAEATTVAAFLKFSSLNFKRGEAVKPDKVGHDESLKGYSAQLYRLYVNFAILLAKRPALSSR